MLNPPLSLAHIARATHGRVHARAEEALPCSGVSTDSRRIAPGELFIALRGEHFDGHDYVREVLVHGAGAALVDEAWLAAQNDVDATLPLVVVADTRRALGALAADWRAAFDLPVIGITGSNGKTTVKELCAAIWRAQAELEGQDGAASVLATQGNLNNDIGLPLMLLRLRPGQRAAIFEMGMNHAGEIDYLTRLARPTVALVNNAQRAHLQGLGSLAAVARAKGEIFHGLSAGGVAVINADDAQADVWRAELATGDVRCVEFGFDDRAQVHGSYQMQEQGGVLDLHTAAGHAVIPLQLLGEHNAHNALAAAAATLASGVSLAAVERGLAGFSGTPGRLQLRPCLPHVCLIDDSYNANPDSMRAAIQVLTARPGRHVLVIGDMGEVGERSGQYHDEIGGYAKSMGVDVLLALGEQALSAVHNFGTGAHHYLKLDGLVHDLLALLQERHAPATTVLVKGSRFMRMERVADALAALAGQTADTPLEK